MSDQGPILWQILLQIFLIALNAIFACAEIAVISFNDNKLARLAETGDKRAKRLTILTDQPSRFLATIQVGITLAGFLGSAFAADNFAEYLVNFLLSVGISMSESSLRTISVLLITIILSYFTLIFGELVPKRIAMRKAEGVALAMSGLIYVVAKIFAPIVSFLTFSTNSILRLLGIDPFADDEEVTEEEIRMMVDAGSETGAIDAEEKEFIHNIFEFDNLTAEDIMTHRVDVVVLWIDDSMKEWDKIIVENKNTMYPICKDDMDDIVGVLNAKDYFRLKDKSRESVMENAVRKPQLVPETVYIDVLFRNMKINKNHFAIVFDEYGGLSGIITMNDILEQLVGDLEDDASIPEDIPLIEKIDENTWDIHGTAELEEVATAIGIPLPIDEYDSFGGMVFGLLGNIPEDGTQPILNEYGLNIQVVEIKDHRIEKSLVSKVITKDNQEKED